MTFKIDYTNDWGTKEYKTIERKYNTLEELLTDIKFTNNDFIIRYDIFSNQYYITIADKPLFYDLQ